MTLSEAALRKGMDNYFSAASEQKLLEKFLLDVKTHCNHNFENIIAAFSINQFLEQTTNFNFEKYRFVCNYLLKQNFPQLLAFHLRKAIQADSQAGFLVSNAIALPLVIRPSNVREGLATSGFLQQSVSWLRSLRNRKVVQDQLLESGLGVLYNISLQSSCRKYFEKYEANTFLLDLLKDCSASPGFRSSALLILMNTVETSFEGIESPDVTLNLCQSLHNTLMLKNEVKFVVFNKSAILSGLQVQLRYEQNVKIAAHSSELLLALGAMLQDEGGKDVETALVMLEDLSNKEGCLQQLESNEAFWDIEAQTLPCKQMNERLRCVCKRIKSYHPFRRMSAENLGPALLQQLQTGGCGVSLLKVLRSIEVNIMKEAVKLRSEGDTCMLAASRRGLLMLTKFFVEDCDADIESRGTITVDREVVEDVFPLWEAARANEKETVVYLVARGANVNAQTASGSSALRVATFYGHADMVELLVNLGADVNVVGVQGLDLLNIAVIRGHEKLVVFYCSRVDNVTPIYKGKSPLSWAMQGNTIKPAIIQTLLEAGSNHVENEYGETPMMQAALMLEENLGLMNLFLSTENVPLNHRVAAVEAFGAMAFIDRGEIELCFHMWRLALELRASNEQLCSEDERLIKLPGPTRPLFKGCREFYDEEGLCLLEQSSPEILQAHALLTLSRVLGLTSRWFLEHLYGMGCRAYNLKQRQEVLLPWRLYLDCLIEFPSMPKQTHLCISSLVRLIDAMVAIKNSPHISDIVSVIVEFVCSRTANTNHSDWTEESWIKPTTACLQAITLLLTLIEASPEVYDEQFCQKNLSQLRLLITLRAQDGRTLLHHACSSDTTVIGLSRVQVHFEFKFPCSKIANLLLDCGADPDVIDNKGDTPLHVAARARGVHEQWAMQTCKLLASRGAHWDLCNKEGKRFWELSDQEDSFRACAPLISPLSCLCMRHLATNRIDYDTVLTPQQSNVVQKHGMWDKDAE